MKAAAGERSSSPGKAPRVPQSNMSPLRPATSAACRPRGRDSTRRKSSVSGPGSTPVRPGPTPRRAPMSGSRTGPGKPLLAGGHGGFVRIERSSRRCPPRKNASPGPDSPFLPKRTAATLVRRLSFDLHGLPPSPEQVAAFVKDTDPAPTRNSSTPSRLARLRRALRAALARSRPLRRTHGFERDHAAPMPGANRDYVIASLNADKPYPRFLREQIAGDVLWPQDPRCRRRDGVPRRRTVGLRRPGRDEERPVLRRSASPSTSMTWSPR